MNPGVRLRVGHQPSQFWPILARFMDYYSPFWGPKAILISWTITRGFVHYYSAFWGPRAISTIDEPRGAFKCSLSTLTILDKSDLFRGLLLTVLGAPKRFS